MANGNLARSFENQEWTLNLTQGKHGNLLTLKLSGTPGCSEKWVFMENMGLDATFSDRVQITCKWLKAAHGVVKLNADGSLIGDGARYGGFIKDSQAKARCCLSIQTATLKPFKQNKPPSQSSCFSLTEPPMATSIARTINSKCKFSGLFSISSLSFFTISLLRRPPSVTPSSFLLRKPSALIAVQRISHSHAHFTTRSYSACPSKDGLPWPKVGPLLQNCSNVSLDYHKGDHGLVFVRTNGHVFESEQALFDYYLQTLATVTGSEEEAKKRIYLVSYTQPFGFGADMDEDTKYKLQVQQSVSVVLDDWYYEARNKAPGFYDMIDSYIHTDPKPEWKSDNWLIHINAPDEKLVTVKEIVEHCIEMLAKVVGSSKEAENKIYSVWSQWPFGFGAQIDQETANKLKGLSDVLKVLPDYTGPSDCCEDRLGILCISPPYTSIIYDPTYEDIFIEDMFISPRSYKNSVSSDEDSEYSDEDSNEDSDCTDEGSNEVSDEHSKGFAEDFKEDSKSFYENSDEVSKYSAGDPKQDSECSDEISECSDEDSDEVSKCSEKVSENFYRSREVKLAVGESCEAVDYSMSKCFDDKVSKCSNEDFDAVSICSRQDYEGPAVGEYPMEGGQSSSCKHWFIKMENPGGEFASMQQRVDCYIRTLASVIGNEEEAKAKIYKIKCQEPLFYFGTEVDEATSHKLRCLPGVQQVVPDNLLNKDHKCSKELMVDLRAWKMMEPVESFEEKHGDDLKLKGFQYNLKEEGCRIGIGPIFRRTLGVLAEKMDSIEDK
ncbi:hypothetical protein IFM89_026677, partial [Coptis chinensis]